MFKEHFCPNQAWQTTKRPEELRDRDAAGHTSGPGFICSWELRAHTILIVWKSGSTRTRPTAGWMNRWGRTVLARELPESPKIWRSSTEPVWMFQTDTHWCRSAPKLGCIGLSWTEGRLSSLKDTWKTGRTFLNHPWRTPRLWGALLKL